MRVTLELHTNMEGALLLLLGNQLLLVPVVCTERVLWVAMTLQVLVFLIIKPLGIRFVLEKGHLMLIVSLEPLVDLVQTLHVSAAHS